MSSKRVSAFEVLIWLTVILLVLLALSPYAVGYKVKSDYTNLIDRLSTVSKLDVRVKSYSQGFFSSTALIEADLPDTPKAITFEEEIVHGPVYLGLINQGKSPFIAAVIKGELNSDNTRIPELKNILIHTSPLLYQHLIDFNGDIQSQTYMPAFKASFVNEMGDVILKSSGAMLTQDFSAVDGGVKGELSLPMLKIQNAATSIDVENLSVSFSGVEGNNQLMMGDTVLSVESLGMYVENDQIAFRDLIVRSTTSEEGHLINSGSQFSVRELLAANQKFGPLKLNVSFNGLDAKSLLEVQKIQATVQESLNKGIPPEQVNAMMLGQVMAVVPELIKQAKVTINPLSINSELGRLESDLQLYLEGIDANTPADPVYMMDAINLELNVSIDEALIRKLISWNLQNSETLKDVGSSSVLKKQIDDNLNALMTENWLSKSEGVYLTKISMSQGVMLINDSPIDVMQLLSSSVPTEK